MNRWEKYTETTNFEALDYALYDYSGERADYPEQARHWADVLRLAAFINVKVAGSGNTRVYEMPQDLLGELPDELARAVEGVQLEVPEDPWPNYAFTEHPIDWPVLIAAHPEALTWRDGMLAWNWGATSAAITDAYRLLDTHGLRPYLGVLLWVETDGKTGVEPTYLATDADITPEMNRRIDDILVAGGRDRELLHDADDLAYWRVAC